MARKCFVKPEGREMEKERMRERKKKSSSESWVMNGLVLSVSV